MMAPGTRNFWATALLAALCVLAAAVPVPAQEGPEQGAGGPAEVALPFSARTLSGDELGLDALLRGKRYVVLTFWGLNCSPCLKEIARLNALWGNPSFREKAGMLAVNTDKVGPKRLVAEMAKRNIEIAFPVATDEGYEITNAYVNGIIPLTVLIDGDRRIRMSILGADPEELTVMEKIVLAAKGEAR